MSPLENLLGLQEIDTALDQLRHRRETLPERSELAEVELRLNSAEESVKTTFAALSEVRSAERAAEDEAAGVETRAAEVERMLYGGTVTAAKELEAYQADLASLKERQSVLEDRAIELLEQAEPLEAELARQRLAVDDESAARRDAAARLESAESGIDAEIREVESGRAELLEGLDPDVVEQYAMLRRSLGGVGAAKLNRDRCEGCHLQIPSAQLEEIRRAPEGEIVNCPECGRILVR
ncbi:MAG: C4-type zinc ribbon domain-containing protein [Microthrixaceae bacterium]